MNFSILYVDDEEHNLVGFRNAFYRRYRIHTARSAAEGMQVLAAHPVQLVVTDQRMPHVTGVDFLRMVKNQFPEVMSIIITGYSDVEVVVKALNELGVFHYAMKPWDTEQLRITIGNALERYRLNQEKERLIAALQQSNEQLEESVQHRTQELERANQAKDRLFSIIAHDLRAPIGNLLNFTQMFTAYGDEISAAEVGAVMHKMQQDLRYTSDLLNNLLNWSMDQLGGLRVSLRPQPVNAFVEKNIRLFQSIADQKRVQLCYELPDNEINAVCDTNMLDVILRNLISNAIKFTPAGGEVRVSLQTEPAAAVVSVMDTGVGIAEHNLEALLGGAAGYTTRGTADEKGTGLGLQLCRDYLSCQGGELLVSSRPNLGSTFRFKLPLAG